MEILKTVLDISPFDWTRVASAMIAGAIVGFERQISGKPIGIRTSILICISTSVFASLAGLNDASAPDLRLAGQIVTGIGFLGAGFILTRGGIVIGVTSAARIWIPAAIGITVGVGHPATGVKLAMLALMVLLGIDTAEKRIRSLRKGLHEKYNKADT